VDMLMLSSELVGSGGLFTGSLTLTTFRLMPEVVVGIHRRRC
jgi:hypothetical protein